MPAQNYDENQPALKTTVVDELNNMQGTNDKFQKIL